MAKEKSISAEDIIRFWKDNRIDAEFTLTGKEIREKFIAYMKTREVSWLEYYGTDGTVRSFIADKAGLSSVIDMDKYQSVWLFLVEDFWETLKAMKEQRFIIRKSDGKYYAGFDGVSYWKEKKSEAFFMPISECNMIIEKYLDDTDTYRLVP